jgi:hypothetical protein
VASSILDVAVPSGSTHPPTQSEIDSAEEATHHGPSLSSPPTQPRSVSSPTPQMPTSANVTPSSPPLITQDSDSHPPHSSGSALNSATPTSVAMEEECSRVSFPNSATPLSRSNGATTRSHGSPEALGPIEAIVALVALENDSGLSPHRSSSYPKSSSASLLLSLSFARLSISFAVRIV